MAAKVSSRRVVRIVGPQECARKITSLESRGASWIARKTATATRIQKLWGDRGMAESDLPTEPDISHSL
jgi:hypothetical protein